jgi:hypothetical protein
VTRDAASRSRCSQTPSPSRCTCGAQKQTRYLRGELRSDEGHLGPVIAILQRPGVQGVPPLEHKRLAHERTPATTRGRKSERGCGVRWLQGRRMMQLLRSLHHAAQGRSSGGKGGRSSGGKGTRATSSARHFCCVQLWSAGRRGRPTAPPRP